MIVKCSKSLSSMIRRTLDMMLEGSERGIISFTTSGMELQSVDATMSCVCSCSFDTTSFNEFDLDTEVYITINIRDFREFIRIANISKYESLTFLKNDEDVNMSVISIPSMETYLLVDNGDLTTYFNISPSNYIDQPSFTISQEEYISIIYHLCVGGGITQVTMCNNVLELQSDSENCFVHYVITDDTKSDSFSIVQSPPNTIRCNYVTKFLKQLCCMVSSCTNIMIYLDENKPITIVMILEDNKSSIVTSIVPYNYE